MTTSKPGNGTAAHAHEISLIADFRLPMHYGSHQRRQTVERNFDHLIVGIESGNADSLMLSQVFADADKSQESEAKQSVTFWIQTRDCSVTRFGTPLKNFGHFERVWQSDWQNFEIIWTNFICNWANFHCS